MVTKQPASLYHVKKNQSYKITAVPDIALLDSLGMHTDTIITLQNRYALGGPVLLRVDTCTVALGKDIAQQIMVEEVAG